MPRTVEPDIDTLDQLHANAITAWSTVRAALNRSALSLFLKSEIAVIETMLDAVNDYVGSNRSEAERVDIDALLAEHCRLAESEVA